MSTGNHRIARSFHRIDATIALVSCGLLAALIVPAIAQSGANSDRINCLNHATRLIQGLFDHHDAHRHFPLASTQWITAKPGHFGDAGNSAGYSWLVKILPSVDESEYYDQLVESSGNFAKHLFDPSVASDNGSDNVASQHHPVEAFLCPTFVAEWRTRDEFNGTLPAVSNYHVRPGTHFYNRDGIGRLNPPEDSHQVPGGRPIRPAYEGNGVMAFPGYWGNKIIDRGLNLSAVSDGTSKTLVYAETIEEQFATWMDGQVTWLVAAWPGNPDTPIGSQRDPKTGYSFFSGWSDSQLLGNWTSIEKSASANGDVPTSTYLSAGRWAGEKDRVWGPSSYHSGVVIHVFADGHGKCISADIDKNVYLYLVTRNGRESLPEEATRSEKGEILRFRK